MMMTNGFMMKLRGNRGIREFLKFPFSFVIPTGIADGIHLWIAMAGGGKGFPSMRGRACVQIVDKIIKVINV